MKKVLSAMLATMMVASINASALICENYTVIEGAADEVVAVNQAFDGTNAVDFVEGDYGVATITEDGKLNIKATSATNEDGTINKVYAKGPILVSASSDVERGQYVMEFELTKNDALVGHQSDGAKVTDPETGKEVLVDDTGVNYGFLVSAKRPANEGTALEKYGVFVPTCMNTQGGVYKYKIVVDEAATFAALEADGVETISGNSNIQKYGQILMKVYELAPGATAYKLLSSTTSYGMNTTLSGKVRYQFGNNALGAVDTFNLYFSTSANSDNFTADDVAPDFNFDTSDYTLDDIRIYAPAIEGTEVTYDYDLCEGAVIAEDLSEQVLGYGKGGSRRVEFPEVVTELYSPWTMTFDAVNTVVGQPLTVCLSSDYSNSTGTHIKSSEEIKDKWYTYKLMYKFSNYTGQQRMTPLTAYRKEVGTDVWEEIVIGEDYIVNKEGVTKTLKSFFQFITWNKDIKAYDVFTEGEWKIKNVQVVPVTAICGNAEIVDGKIVAEINIAANGARAAYAATYKAGKIVDVVYIPVAESADTFRVELPYSAATADAATLYVWDGNAEPTLEVIDLLAAAQK